MKGFLILICLIILISIPLTGKSELLDKIVAVVNKKEFTLSELKQIEKNIAVRQNISPFIYNFKSFDAKKVIDVLIQTEVIRKKLQEVGYQIGDEQVNEQVKETERRFKLSREQLLLFLKENSITFEEYFELVRASLEYNIFRSKVISPLILVTDQQIKKSYFEQNQNQKTVAFKYHLVSGMIDKKFIKDNKELNEIPKAIKNFQKTGHMPSNLESMEFIDLGIVAEDGLTTDVSKLLRKTEEGGATSGILKGNNYQFFLVKKKELAQSDSFKKAKETIKQQLFEEESNKMIVNWLQNEKLKHHIKIFTK